MTYLKRRWIQIHLSTAMVVMFVAGGLVYLNSLRKVGRDYITLDSEEATIIAATLNKGMSRHRVGHIRTPPVGGLWYFLSGTSIRGCRDMPMRRFHLRA
jgi:hypothetical protein